MWEEFGRNLRDSFVITMTLLVLKVFDLLLMGWVDILLAVAVMLLIDILFLKFRGV